MVFFTTISATHAHMIAIMPSSWTWDGIPEAVIHHIVQFYSDSGLTPRIYTAFLDNEYEILKPYLESSGFTITLLPGVYLIFPREHDTPVDSSCVIRRISDVTDSLIELIHAEDEGDWTVNVLKAHVNDRNFHLFGLFQSDKCVSMASAKIMNGYSRVDDVLTHPAFRGQHLATDLMSYLARYHRSISNNQLYLWAVNPIAIRLYKNIGFQLVDINKICWSAFLDRGRKAD